MRCVKFLAFSFLVTLSLCLTSVVHAQNQHKASAKGMSFSSSPFHTFQLQRSSDEGCGTSLQVTVVSGPVEVPLDVEGLAFTATQSGEIDLMLKLECSALHQIIFEFDSKGEWGDPWVISTSDGIQGKALSRTPLSQQSDTFSLQEGENVLKAKVLFAQPSSITLLDWKVLSTTHQQWYEESISSLGGAWSNDSGNGELVWSRTSVTPTPSQLLPLTGCVNFGMFLVDKHEFESCIVSGQPMFYPLPSGNRWFVQADDIQSVLSLQAQKPKSEGDVIISEVNWAGSFEGALLRKNDQWLELYNPTETLWNLAGVRFQRLGIFDEELKIQNTVLLPSHGYLIIGRQKDSFTFLEKNPNVYLSSLRVPETLSGARVLSFEGQELDRLPDGPWQAGFRDLEKQVFATAQRKHPSLPGGEWSSWGTCETEPVDRCSGEFVHGWKNQNEQNRGTPWHLNVL